MDVRSIGDNIARLRTEKGISQEMLAEMVGVNRTTIVRIENGSCIPRTDTVADICNALEVSADEVIQTKYSSRANKALWPSDIEKGISALPPAYREKFMETARILLKGYASENHAHMLK